MTEKKPTQVTMTKAELDNVIADHIKKNQTVNLIAIALVAVAAFFAASHFGKDSPVTVFLNDLQEALVTTEEGVSSTVVVSGSLIVPAGSTISLTDVQ